MKATVTLGKCKITRPLFIHWYNKTQSGATNLATFLRMDFTYQLGTYLSFLIDNNLCCNAFIDSYEIFVIDHQLIKEDCDYVFKANLHYQDDIRYIERQDDTYLLVDNQLITYDLAIEKAFLFLNTYGMKTTPF